MSELDASAMASALLTGDDLARSENLGGGLPLCPVAGAAVMPHRYGDRAVVEYRLVTGERLFAKCYADVSEGLLVSRILHTLWSSGFGPDSAFRVPEPLGYSIERGVLVVRAASGRCLQELETGGRRAWAEGLRSAARWLAALHDSPVRVGPNEGRSRLEEVLARRLAKARERRPEMAAALSGMAGELQRRLDESRLGPLTVQTHGRYHSGHVFCGEPHVTVIDLDRADVADPAKDVAEFIHRLRADTMKRRLGAEVADRATSVFLDEYRSRAGVALHGLAYYWSASVLATLLHAVRKRHLEEKAWRRRLAFYDSEFAAIPARVARYRLS